MKQLLIFTLLLTTTSIFAQQKLAKDDLEALKNRMEGNFDSKEQSEQDPAYYNIALHMKQIWETRKNKNGYWLYVEQALASDKNRPYRQRIYHLYKKDNETIVCLVYEMRNPLRFAGAWNDAAKMKQINRDSLVEKEGCAIFIKKDEDGNFYGSTSGKGCESTLKGAEYATSEISVYPNMFISWDRGWNKYDQQVWGAEKGGYKFRKFTLLRSDD